MPRRWWAMGPNTAFHSAANAGTTQRNGSPKMPPERPGSNCSGESEYAARKPSSGCGTAPRTSAPAPPTEAPRVLQKGLKGEGGDPRTLPPRDASTLDSRRCRATRKLEISARVRSPDDAFWSMRNGCPVSLSVRVGPLAGGPDFGGSDGEGPRLSCPSERLNHP